MIVQLYPRFELYPSFGNFEDNEDTVRLKRSSEKDNLGIQWQRVEFEKKKKKRKLPKLATKRRKRATISVRTRQKFFVFRFQRTGITNPTVGKDECLRRSRRKTIKRELARLAKQLTVVKSTSSLVLSCIRAPYSMAYENFDMHLSLCPRGSRPRHAAPVAYLANFAGISLRSIDHD